MQGPQQMDDKKQHVGVEARWDVVHKGQEFRT